MTDIDVPDWVTRAAEEARVNCLNAFTVYGSAGVEERYHMAMKAALRAALSAWVVHAGYENQWHSTGNKYVSRDPSHPDDGTSQTLFTLRQEKPE